jgi:hypothetical protein
MQRVPPEAAQSETMPKEAEFTERLLEGFSELFNRKIAEVVSRMAKDHYGNKE